MGIIALSLMLTACGGDTSGTDATTTEPTTTTTTIDDDIRNPVDISSIEMETSTTLENPNITYFGFYDMRVAGDIKPAVKLYEETYGGTIDYYEVAWGDRLEKLNTLIASGDSPDLVDKDGNTFPYLVSRNIYEDLTDYIDLSLPQWSGVEDLIAGYQWKGKQYYYPFSVDASPNILIYNVTLFEEYGIDDPKEQYLAGEWDWNAFKNAMVQFIDNGTDVQAGWYGVTGNDLINSTGTPLIGMDGGKIVNNFNNQNVERAMAFLEELRKENLTYLGDGFYSDQVAPIMKGTAAFLGTWGDAFSSFKQRDVGFEFSFVPFPRDPSADKYYVSVSTFGYLVPSGSQNIEGAAAFINTVRLNAVDPELKAISKESIMTDKNYTEEEYEYFQTFKDIENFNTVNSLTDGFTQDINDILATNVLYNITYERGEDMQTWAQIKGSYENIINDTIDSYNN